MEEEESLSERQEAEVEALKAIYDEDFDDLRDHDVWKVIRPPEFTLKIRPNHDSKVNNDHHGAKGLCQSFE
jgi:hypothetical protein